MWRGSPDAREGAKTSAMRNGKVDLHPPSLSVTRCTSNLSRDMGLKKLIS